MTNARPVALLDPHPRHTAMVFNAAQLARMHALVDVVTADVDGPLPNSLVEATLPQASVILGQTDLPAERIARAPLLKAVINIEGNFLPNVDAEACFARGIELLSVAPVFAVPVAEMALGLALDLARGISTADRAVREGKERYGRAGCENSVLLTGATIGLVGFGQLGRALRRLVAGFRPRLLVHDPWLPAATLEEEGCEAVGLDDLLARSDVVFLLAGVTKDNPGFINAAALRLLRDGAIVVLASRAAIVDFPALIAESERLRIATDVFPVEPIPPRDPVRASAMLLSPHRAGGVPAAFHDMGERVLDDLALILAGLPPVRLQRAQRQSVGLMRSAPGRSYSRAEAAKLAAR